VEVNALGSATRAWRPPIHHPDSQLGAARWHEQIADPTVADGILDRCSSNQNVRRFDAQEPRQALKRRALRGFSRLAPGSPR